NDAGFASIHVKIDDAGQKAPALHQIDELVGIERDVLRRFALALDNARPPGLTAHPPSAACAGARARQNFDGIDMLGHWLSLLTELGGHPSEECAGIDCAGL